MKRSFLKVSLLIALGFVNAVFTSCEDDYNDLLPPEEEAVPMDWVEINGVKWATGNVSDYPEEHKRNSYYSREDAGRVCYSYNKEGENWRLPTVEEFRKLLDAEGTLTTINGVVGRQFGSGDNTIFLPATGYSSNFYIPFYIPGVNTGYWSSQKYLMRIESCDDEHIREFASFLHFSEEEQDDILIDDIETRDVRFAVRCVCELE